jgi:mannose-1-phosphate guanylyltransferase
MNYIIFSLIMAGGSGTRFWPRRRDKKPKQLLSVFENETLIQSTINRFLPIIPIDNIYIISKQLQKEEILMQNLTVNNDNILYEPVGRNTLPCIALASIFIRRRNPDGIIVVSPSDHLVRNLPLFRSTIKAACKMAADNNVFITIGINPESPATGYGYIRKADKICSDNGVDFFKVRRFVEKPDLITAEQYFASGEYLWNSGLFIFKSSVLWNIIAEFTPILYDSLMEIDKYMNSPVFEKQLTTIYGSVEAISIDNGLMEKAGNIYVIEGGFQWNDLGGWDQVYELSEKDGYGNATAGNVVVMDTENSYAHSDKGLVVLMGIIDLLVVQDGNATLVANRNKSEEIKQLVTLLKSKELHEYT